MKGNHMKQMRVKVKENPLQFIVILGCFIILAFLICAGVVYQSAKARRISREQGTVLLEEAGAFRADMEEEIKTLSKQLSEKSMGLDESEQILRELTDEYESSLDTYSMQQISATTETLGTIRESIRNSELLIEKIQESLQSSSVDTKTLMTEQANELLNKLTEIDKRYETSAGELKSLIDRLGKDQSETAKELTEKLGEVESNLAKSSKTQVAESAKEIKEAFDKRADDMSKLLTNQYETLSSNMTDGYEELEKQYDALGSDLGNRYDSLSLDLGNRYDSLSSDLGNRYNSLTSELGNRYDTLSSDLKDSYDALGSDLGNRYNSLTSDLGNRYDTLSSNLKDSYDSLGSDLGNRYDTLSSDLGNRYDSLSSNLGDRYDALSSDLGNQYNTLSTNLGDQYNSLSTDLGGKYDALNSSVAENYTYLQGQLTQFQQNLISMGEENQSMKEYLEQQFGTVDGKLSQVFQSVSSGKSMLASALLTKGVEIPQDASFQQIKEGILSIPQTIYLGNETQYLPGTISYEYHNHVDGEGNTTDGQENREESGGCYTVPVYHVHDDSCYENYSYLASRYDPVSWSWTNAHTHGNSYTGVPDNCRTCSYCGAHEIYGGHENHAVRVDYIAIGTRLSCTKEAGETIDSYSVGCGLLEGQITGAHIVY